LGTVYGGARAVKRRHGRRSGDPAWRRGEPGSPRRDRHRAAWRVRGAPRTGRVKRTV